MVEWCRNPFFLISRLKYDVPFFFFSLQMLTAVPITLSLINIKSFCLHFGLNFYFILYVLELDVASIMEEARTRWLRPNEIHAMLCNRKYFTINVKPMNLPKSNYLLLLVVVWCLCRDMHHFHSSLPFIFSYNASHLISSHLIILVPVFVVSIS